MNATPKLDDDPILTEIIRRLVKEFNPIRIYLFGSRARGEQKEGSDYDLLLIVPQTGVPNYKLAQHAHCKVLQGIQAPVDVVIISEIQFESRKTVIGTLSELAIHEGKELYVA